MREKSKLKTGLKTERTAIQYGIKFSLIERKKIIEDYLSSGKSKQEIWAKYTGRPTEHGSILRWMVVYHLAPITIQKKDKAYYQYFTKKYIKKRSAILLRFLLLHASNRLKQAFVIL
jgi:hypothetical protein